ncbi:MAG: hypothetical protein WCT00_03855 [Bacilli bacterium]|jgi:hypothetical protein|nr:hypothetical protein [Acholeplasmataceae bacterium]
MIKRKAFPIIEFADNPIALINPENVAKHFPKLDSDKLIITFFEEVIKN